MDEAEAKLRSLAKVVVRRRRGLPYATVYLPPERDLDYLKRLVEASAGLAKVEREALGHAYRALASAGALPGASRLLGLTDILRRELRALERAERSLEAAASSGSMYEISRAAGRYAARAARLAALMRLALSQAAEAARAQQAQAQGRQGREEAQGAPA